MGAPRSQKRNSYLPPRAKWANFYIRLPGDIASIAVAVDGGLISFAESWTQERDANLPSEDRAGNYNPRNYPGGMAGVRAAVEANNAKRDEMLNPVFISYTLRTASGRTTKMRMPLDPEKLAGIKKNLGASRNYKFASRGEPTARSKLSLKQSYQELDDQGNVTGTVDVPPPAARKDHSGQIINLSAREKFEQRPFDYQAADGTRYVYTEDAAARVEEITAAVNEAIGQINPNAEVRVVSQIYDGTGTPVLGASTDRMAERHDAAIFEHRARAWETYLRWGVAALAVVGISAALILWAWGKTIEKPDPLIVEPRVIQPPEVKVVIDGSGLQGASSSSASRTEIIRQAAEDMVGSIASKSCAPEASDNGQAAPPAPEVLNFVIFKEIPFARGKISQINVGMRYETAGDKRPAWQWCYVTTPNPSGTKAQVDLAHVYGQRRVDSPMTTAMARDLGVNVADLEAAKSRCSFE